MDRETRKANLKKLQLPKSSGSKQQQQQQQRTTRQSKKSSLQNANTAISKYFANPEKLNNNIEQREVADNPNKVISTESPIENAINTRSKRTKLDAFVFKEPLNVPTDLKKVFRNSINDDDFTVPEKRIKKAPKLDSSINQSKSSKVSKAKKKQTTIKSAFLRNEEIFAEIAAQHCAADQFDGDDVQLALAISKSEAESIGITSPNGEAETVVENIDLNAGMLQDRLKKYGFKTAEKKDYNTFAAAFLPKSKRLKSKWANKFTALTLRQPEIQKKKLQNNIENLLNSQFRTKTLTSDEQCVPLYKIQSSFLKQSSLKGTNCILHKLNEENQANELFFVQELFDINVLPAGYLLKDWTAIQGRDLTPKAKSHKQKERLQKLENIYQELDDYFKTRKCLNWENRESNESAVSETQKKFVYSAKVKNKQENFIEVKGHGEKAEENVELKKMVELIEEMQKNNNQKIGATDATILYNGKIKELLASTNKILDNMDVSSCSFKTQATINTTQKTRSNSPDLFADSDVEIEAEQPENENKQTLAKNSSLCTKAVNFNDKIEKISSKIDNIKESHNNYMETIDTEVTTYEIFSSDEVKNISSSELNKSTKQELHITNQRIDNGPELIDLTQGESASPDKINLNLLLNQSKSIVEIDLFAESPLQKHHNSTDINICNGFSNSIENNSCVKISNSKDINTYPELCSSTHITSCPRLSKHIVTNSNDTIKFTLSSENNYKQEDCSIISLSPDDSYEKNGLKTDTCDKIEDEGDNIVLRERVLQQTNTTLQNIEEFKQMETVHKEEVFKDDLKGNDSLFRELCNKYLKEANTTSSLKKQTTDLEKSLSQSYTNFVIDFNMTLDTDLKQNTAFEKSFSQPLHKATTKTPQKNMNYNNFTMDFEVNRSLKRKSTSFMVKTPQKNIVDFNTILPKSHSFKNDRLNVSVDLTQQLGDDSDDENLIDEDDDCLVLSDDEINYSIWQANKTFNFKNSEQSDMENDLISLPDVNHSSDEDIAPTTKVTDIQKEAQPVEKFYSDFDISISKFVTTNEMANFQNFQKSDMENDIISLPHVYDSDIEDFSKTGKQKNILEKEQQQIVEESSSDCEILTPKYKTTKELSSQEEPKFDRSEFGILEEYSQTIDFTPTKVLTEASFLSSPTEKSAPMKLFGNYQSSSQKFKDLLSHVDRQPSSNVETLEDFDEFDRLVYSTPSKVKRNLYKKPQGIEKLLTAEISFNEKASVCKNFTKHIDTPTLLTSDVEEIKYNNKTYTVRYVNSPKPDYTQLSEAELHKKLYNYGIKPLKRKQAVKLLEYIYNQTHPILSDEANEKKKSIAQVNSTKFGEYIGNRFDQPCTSKSVLLTKSLLSHEPTENELKIPSCRNQMYNSADTVKAKLNLQDSCGKEMLRYSNFLKAELCDENYILQTNVTKKTPRPLLPFHIAWYNLICSNRKLHETILMYEPIDLEEIYSFLKGLGYRYDPKDLKTFFDRRCIIFRYDLTPATKQINRHVRKSKRSNKIKG